MTPNDAQVDVLLRRYAGGSQTVPATEHLDADELNAFAEGSLPEASRSRYVSHLVDCDHCRQIVSQLAISSGALLAEPTAAPEASGSAWWKRLSGFFSPLTLRYAAFAMVLIAAGGVVFLVMRRPPPASDMVARNEQTNAAPASVVKPSGDATPQTGGTSPPVGNQNKQSLAAQPEPDSKSSPSSDQTAKLDDQLRPGDYPASPPKPATEGEATTHPSLAAKKAAEPAITETVPSYAPPPPVAKQAEVQSREQQTMGGAQSVSGPRQSQQSPYKVAGRAGTDKDERSEDSARLVVNQAPASKRASDEKTKGPRRDAENNAVMNRTVNEVSPNASKTAGTGERGASEDKPPETRSAGGRKFKRQGNAWVDTKFKSSMSLKSISRSSSEFASLDSGLRSVAQQLGGEVIVVWKGKGYLIK